METRVQSRPPSDMFLTYIDGMIPFNKAYYSGKEEKYLKDVIARGTYAGNGHYTALCEQQLQKLTGSPKVLMTSSCTHALEMCALLCDIRPGDEVIMASYNFVSAANAFVLRGARIVFVDIRPDTMNIDENLIEAAITDRTRAIVAMHYGGVACEMDTILQIAEKHQLWLIEDAAHCIGAYYKNRHLGSIGHLGTLSFHATKNIHCGEGGALLVNDTRMAERAEILREKGTNRQQFKRKEVDKYTWVDMGSSYLMSEMSAAFLYGQLQDLQIVNKKRLAVWEYYYTSLSAIVPRTKLPNVPRNTEQNAHIFFIKCKDENERRSVIKVFAQRSIEVSFHYTPLHSSKAGKTFSQFHGLNQYTTIEAQRILRLPLYPRMTSPNLKEVVKQLTNKKMTEIL